MDTTHNKDLGDKTWNNEQKKGDLNEGFSGENVPEDYNPAKHVKETETDSDGNKKTVDRARNAERTTDDEGKWKESGSLKKSDLSEEKIEGREDHNYDSPNRK
ncbi:hypothetical protein [Flavobacterium selenitireducens]|uniref:hypothetical protein n=1 Tax=Flavobacterium selenitireducens TaxID=2722704 RepID=UPI00168B2F35|nr:hypothetical protein [Flavobacterium selenitireducens]MBD3582820.1 hypothetical protein [Flavobacterium selenitireducens]